MTGWYSLVPAGAISLGNLTPVGQNSGQVGCRFPPNGHHLAACLRLPTNCQLWGAFWHHVSRPNDIFITLPQTTYCLEGDLEAENKLPSKIFRSQWREGRWQVKSGHQQQNPVSLGGEYLIEGCSFRSFWNMGRLKIFSGELVPISQVWQSLTMTHNSRDNYVVKDEAGFFAEMATFMTSGWSILVKIIGDYTPPKYGCLGAGATPVAINPLQDINDDWLDARPEKTQGAVLLTGALWQKQDRPVSIPYPIFHDGGETIAYAAETAIPWQSWKKITLRGRENKRVQTLTPGEWLTSAGAVYLWGERCPVKQSEPLRDDPNAKREAKRFNNWALGYGHLWLF